jgi:lysyl-tRNA synthetase class 2
LSLEREVDVKRPFLPSDYVRARPSATTVLIAGRVTLVSEKSLQLADALATVSVRLLCHEDVRSGDWIVLRARRAARGLREARVVERYRAGAPPEETERLRDQRIGARLVERARAYASIRRFFDRQGFIEVDTPVRVPAAGTDVYIEPIQAEGGFLITSPEFQMKRLLVAGMPKIYQLSHVSRNYEKGTLHEPEFSLLEWYRAFSPLSAVMRDTERIVTAVVRALNGGPRLNVLGKQRVECAAPFERISVKQAFRRYAGILDASDLAASDEDRYFQLLVDQVEPALAKRKRPVFLCDYPISQAALARPKPDDPSYAERFELYVGGVELCNGYGELTDPVIQRSRFEQDNATRQRRGLPQYPLDERFLNALEQGMPPAAGNALGVDRLLALALGATSITEVMAFPAERLELSTR